MSEFIPNQPFDEMTEEELDKWHREEHRLWCGESIEESIPEKGFTQEFFEKYNKDYNSISHNKGKQ